MNWPFFATVALVYMINALDKTQLASALGSIGTTFRAFEYLTWVFTVELVLTTVSLPLIGYLADRFGYRLILSAALLIHVIGSAFCGGAQEFSVFLFGRALQGIGNAGVFVLALAAIADVVPPREVGRFHSYLSLAFVFPNIFGALLGGFLVQYLSWHWCFWINIPSGLVALVFVWNILPKGGQGDARQKLDYWGLALLMCFLTALLVFLQELGSRDMMPLIGLPLLGSLVVVSLLALVRVERRAEHPILPLRFFRTSLFRGPALLEITRRFAFLSLLIYIPLKLQILGGYSPAETGALITLMTGMITVASFISARLVQWLGHTRLSMIFGVALCALACGISSTAGSGALQLFSSVTLLAAGLGFGIVTVVNSIAAQNMIEKERRGREFALMGLVGNLGGAVGLSLLGLIFSYGLVLRVGRSEAEYLLDRFAHYSNKAGVDGAISMMMAEEPALGEMGMTALGRGFSDIFLFGLLICVLGLITAWRMTDLPLKESTND